jgi:hypothetical protein
VENTVESEDSYLEELKKVGSVSLFSKTNSWFFGENIPGMDMMFGFMLVTFEVFRYWNRVIISTCFQAGRSRLGSILAV